MKKMIICLLLIAMLFSAVAQADSSVTVIGISEETAAFRDALFDELRASAPSDQTAAFNAVIGLLKDRTEQVFPDVPVEHTLTRETAVSDDLYSLSDGDDDRIVLYIHGGAWIYEIDPLHVAFCDRLVDELNAKVYMPLYPLSPEVSCLEAYEMLHDVYKALLAENKPVIIMGDSAGATITLGFTHYLAAAGEPLPERLVVMAPCADMTFSNEAIRDYQENDAMLPRDFCAACARLWTDDADWALPEINPIRGDYQDFPDTLMFIGTYDILCPDDLLLYDKMTARGTSVTLVKGEGFWHVYPLYEIAEQAQCLALIRDFCL